MNKVLELLNIKSVKELKEMIIEKNEIGLGFLDLAENLFKENMENQTFIEGKRDLLNYLRSSMGFLNHEEFKIIHISTNKRIVHEETLFKGTIDRSTIYPRLIIENAIKYNTKFLIFAHNHPSTNYEPSQSDINLTKELETLMKAFDIKIIDHIIITSTLGYYSFLEEGLIEY